MATGKHSDFVLYDDQYYGGMYEAISQFVAAFNGASNGALTLQQKKLIGSYSKESFIKKIAGMVSRRDLTSVSTASDLAVTLGEMISVKVNRKIGPVGQTIGAWRAIGQDSAEMSLKIGRMVGEEKMADYLNTAVACTRAAIANTAELLYDATGTAAATLNHSRLISGMAKFGDRANRLVAWVMHSKAYFDLMGNAVTDKITNVADVAIYGGSPGTFNKPVIVTDAAGLMTAAVDVSGTSNDVAAKYDTLGLVAGAGGIVESEEEQIVFDTITGLEQLIGRIQGEYAFNVGVKGYKWDTTYGGANPTDAALATGSNWDQVATSVKDCAGVCIRTF
jgi:hypothetical protein